MDIQKILTYTTFAVAVLFLLKKFFWKKRGKKDKHCGENCDCH